MTYDEFRASLSAAHPPAGAGPLLEALWHDARGDWDRAHAIAQDVPGADGGAAVHAYLHRKEGDAGYAAYWYRRAGRTVATDGLDAEWERLVREFLR